MTTAIQQADLIESIAAALQYISYYHPADYIAHLARAYEREQSPAAKDAIAQILTNSKMSATGHRPICQDTGIVNVFLKIGMDCRLEGFTGSLEDAVNEGVRRGYLHPENTLRASVVADPQFARKNTNGQHARGRQRGTGPRQQGGRDVAAKGGGSENKSKMVMLNPSDSIVDWVLKTGAHDGRRLVPARHAGHRHRRHGGKGSAAGQGSVDGRHRHVRAAGEVRARRQAVAAGSDAA
jgi:fumarate hydratase class I